MAVNNLKEMLTKAVEGRGESPDNMLLITIAPAGYGTQPTSEVSLNELGEYEGDTGFGSESLPRLYAWTADHVYFKSVYDGSEGIDSVPRNPCDDQPERH